MLPASNNGVGMNVGFPDVCLTPVGPAVVPIPYPNMGMNVMAVPFSPNILLTMMPALNMASTMPITLGDQPGVANPLYMMAGGYVVGNPTILVNGLPGVNLTCPTYGNMHNDSLGAALVPSVTNVLFSYARDASQHLDVEALASLGELVISAPLSQRVVGGLVGYLRFPVIASDAPARVHSALRDFASKGIASVVFDLRDCRGGDLDAALDVAAELLPDGAELATVVDGDGDETTHYARRSHAWGMRLTVMVNRTTASSAEVLAGCLQAHGRAVIAGERTYGKGTCQRIAPSLGTGATSTETVAEVLLPGRRRIERVGIVRSR